MMNIISRRFTRLIASCGLPGAATSSSSSSTFDIIGINAIKICRVGISKYTTRESLLPKRPYKPLPPMKLLDLANLQPAPGSRKKRKRTGRGPGSNRNKTCGRGHQFSRSTPWGFEGGQTPLYKRLPKIGMKNINKKYYAKINLDTLQQFIDQKRLTLPDENAGPNGKAIMITIRDLISVGLTTIPKDGIKLLARGKQEFRSKIHLEVSKASVEAIKTIEKYGGTVTCSYFSPLALRALTKPWKFDLLPMRPRPPPKATQWYLKKECCGYLSPEVQARNLKLFGAVTSEQRYREEHANRMVVKRAKWAQEREKTIAAVNKHLSDKEAKIIRIHERRMARKAAEAAAEEEEGKNKKEIEQES